MRSVCVKMIHKKCRGSLYPLSNVQRFEVPEEKVPWNIDFPEYKPVVYTAASLQNKPWADPEIEEASFKPKWNSMDDHKEQPFSTDKINRKSFMGEYVVNKDGYPLNPMGRTGIIGRGLLGHWGPNHAADPIVTRWKRNATGALKIDPETKKSILQFVAIQRRDSGEWAIPGGMIDPGETVSATLMREFMEETMNSLQKSEEERQEIVDALKKFFQQGEEIYKGYVDDPRNTDNAWIETVALNFHDENDNVIGKFALTAGDDATNVRWMDVDRNLNLYASHNELIKSTIRKRNAHW